jgi:hypothetical protein
MELILGIFLSGVVGGIIGQYKGRLGQGVVLGMLLGPIGWLCVLCGKDMRRTCAFCAESIKDQAKFCPHCGREQPKLEPKPALIAAQSAKKTRVVDYWPLALVVAVLLAMAAYAALSGNQPLW